jgi:hypothetical protein
MNFKRVEKRNRPDRIPFLTPDIKGLLLNRLKPVRDGVAHKTH